MAFCRTNHSSKGTRPYVTFTSSINKEKYIYCVKCIYLFVWEPLISRFEAKLSKWNQKNLSMGAKVTLIKSVLNALPIYLLSFFKIPQRIVDWLVSLQRNFMWGRNQHQKRVSWVKWDVICLPKSEGGLLCYQF